MKIALDHIQNKAMTLQGEEPLSTFPVLSAMQAKGECRFTGPISYTVTAAREYDHVRVSGRITAPLEMHCSRCLAVYQTGIDTSFTIIYRKGSEQESGAEEEVELSDQDLISSLYSGDEIDLTHEIEEQVAMEVPLKPLCSEECRGLCSSCGTDLNQGTCSCSQEKTDIRFSVLKDFKVNR